MGSIPTGTEVTLFGRVLDLVRGDIACQPGFVAIVNAANAQLRPGGGVAGAIHRAAGPGLAEECREHAPIRPGQAVITSGHELPNPFVIHCLGPVYGVDEPGRDLLASCYRRALDLAEAHRVSSIAFSAISTGAFGYPVDEAAEISLRVIVARLPRLVHVERLRFVLASREALDKHVEALERLVGSDLAGAGGDPPV
jgi:O-acetyl-ADP-ribose deacetylase (regulator of RNase III)